MVDDPAKRLVYKQNFYFRVKTIDTFNLKALYTMIHEWFVEEEYCGEDHNFPEIYLRERHTQKMGREVLVRWLIRKQPFGIKFYNRTFDVMIKVIGIKDVEVMQEGKKYKFQKGSFEIKVWSFLEYDAEMKWRNHPILKHLLEIFVKRIYRKEMEQHRQELRIEMEGLQKAIKEYLSLLRFDEKNPNIKNVAHTHNPWM